MEIYLNGVLASFLIMLFLLVSNNSNEKFKDYDNTTVALSIVILSATSWAFVALKSLSFMVELIRGK